MPCTARYAAAWEFVTFFCVNSLVVGADNSGGAGNAFLTDTNAHFVSNHNIQANVGMVLYNLTDGSSGPVTAVTDTTITATLTGGTGNLWDNGDSYRIVPIDAQEIAVTENFLDIVAANIWAALGSVGACDCTLSSWGAEFLKKLNIIEAGALYQCPCQGLSFSDERRNNLLVWSNDQLALLRSGEIEVCDGETGSLFPSLTWADQGWTDYARARIVSNDIDRNS